MHFSVGDEEPIVVIDGKAVDPAEVGLIAITDELGIAGFGIEDEDCADFLIGHIHQALGIDRDAVGAD